MTQKLITTDVLVIGGGLAGERCAIEAARAGQEALILSLVPPRRSHSCAAQGGMQAALANCVKAEGDSTTVHFLDTVRGSDWGADQEVANIFAEEAVVAVRELAHFGVPWTRVRGGKNKYFIKGENVEIDEALEKDGLITHRDFGGTAKWRACYAAAGTGHSALYAVDSEVVRLGISVRDRTEAVALIHDGARCVGAVVRDLRDGSHFAVMAKATVIATGGYGRIYGQYTSNATINEGTGASIALDTGVVPLGNMEAVQFHPATVVPAGILVTEGCRGDGGYLLDKDMKRFMVEAEPEKQELASRDVVSRHMVQRIRDGYGVESPYGPHLWLDIRHLGEEHLRTKLLEVWDICRDFVGINPAEELIPVRPTQHYSMGGVRVNKDGQAYGLAGLFAVGEAACWDMHGFNRLGGNSLSETIVTGRIVGGRVAEFVDGTELRADTGIAFDALAAAESKAADWLARSGNGPSVYDIRDAMGETMMHKVGIFRTGEELSEAVAEIGQLLVDCDKAVLRCKDPGVNPELAFALRLKGMLRLAMTVAKGAQARTESRGAHFRTDFPIRNDRDWLSRTLVRWGIDDDEPSFSYEPTGIIDLPPGHRGYGSDERVEMVDTLENYNASVLEEQTSHGRLASTEEMGSRLDRGAWKALSG
jgi:fumarate reductase flavoprotein subunit